MSYSHTTVWLGTSAGLAVYRLISPTETPFAEHLAGMFFSGGALFAHWLTTKDQS